MMNMWQGASRLSIAPAGMVACLALASCSGGESGGGTASVATPITGTFVDSPVNGLHYTSVPSNPAGGVTANGGQYQCVPGDTVTFDLGRRVIGIGQPCGELVTVVSVFGATSITDLRVRNLAQLLLTLGGIPAGSQPIELPATIPATLPAHLNFADSQFEQMLQAALPGKPLVSQDRAAAHLSASFKTVTVTGVTSGTVTSIPAGLVCTGGTCSYDFVAGTRVILAAIGTGFTGWNGDGCTGAGTCQILLTATQAVRAVFLAVPPPATLTINPNQGTGTGQVQCSTGGAFGPCAASYPIGTALTLRGVANSGSTFTGWSNGTGDISCTGTANCSVTVTADSSVTATFTLAVTNFSVTAVAATANGGGGTVQCSVNGGAAGACGSYPAGSTIVMTATPNSVSNFTGWTGAGCAGTGSCTFTLTGNTAVAAHFNRPTLTVQVNGTGSVSSTPTGINNCTSSCTAPFNKGTAVTLSATGAGFSGWIGGSCSGTGTCGFSLSGNMAITAAFGSGSAPGGYHFFASFASPSVAGPLLAVSSTSPGSTPATVTASFTGAGQVYRATWDATAKQFKNLESAYLVYADGGKIWRVNSAGSSEVPGSVANPAIQVSNETGAMGVCKLLVIDIASATPGTARIAYELPGADASCSNNSDNVIKVVRVLDTSATPPVVLATGLRLNAFNTIAVYNLTTGDATHVFVTDVANNNTAKIVNLSTNVVTSIQANVPGLTILAQDTSDRVFVRNYIDEPTPHSLYVYTVSTNSLVSLVTATTQSGLLWDNNLPTSDGTNLYVADGGTLYRVPLTSTSASDVIQLLSINGWISGVIPSINRVYVVQIDDSTGGGGLVSVAKTGGTPRIDVAPTFLSFVLPVNISRNGLVFYTRLTSTVPPGTFFPVITSATAEILREDGSTAFSQAEGWFIGGMFESWLGVSSERFSQKNNFLLTSPGMSFVGGTLSSVDAASGTQSVMMGAIPATWNISMLPSFPFVMFEFLRSSGLGFAHSGGTFNLIFFVDSAVPNSLIQVPVSGSMWQPVP